MHSDGLKSLNYYTLYSDAIRYNICNVVYLLQYDLVCIIAHILVSPSLHY